jgi:formate hydrogenlyase subunit 3/multisubunit Na+/H+ antiporter MnhD subunit
MKIPDWLIIALIVCAAILPFISPERLQQMKSVLVAIAIFGCVLMLAWMWFADGAHSKIWRWLPPFWPCGWCFTGTGSRWVVVVLLILGTVMGIISQWLSR